MPAVHAWLIQYTNQPCPPNARRNGIRYLHSNVLAESGAFIGDVNQFTSLCSIVAGSACDSPSLRKSNHTAQTGLSQLASKAAIKSICSVMVPQSYRQSYGTWM